MTHKSTWTDFPPHDLDDSINLESKVLLALSRLQNRKTRKKTQYPKAVSCKNVVQFLKANYSWLDGDIQSQVMTALLSFIKLGIVCILDNAKYRLLIPNSKVMNSVCVTRNSHGPQCCCLFTLKCSLRTSPRFCCYLKNFKKVAGSKKKLKSKVKGNKKKNRALPSRVRNLRSAPKKKRQTKCTLNAKELVKAKKSNNTFNKKSSNSKCLYCLESHSQPKPKKQNAACNAVETPCNVPFDIFTPQDEVIGIVETTAQK